MVSGGTMIPEEVEYRLANDYFMRDMKEDFENRLSGGER